MIFIKLGGSLITNKNKPFSVNWDNLSNTAKSISEIDEEMIIGHGGGSFGHFVASEYIGMESGYPKIREAMQKLNIIVVSSLIAKGVPAASFSTSSFMLSKGGKITDNFYKSIMEASKKYIPVIHGDAILDREDGYKVFSTEQIFAKLARSIHPRRIFLATDSAVLDNGDTVKEIADWNFRDVVSNLSESTSPTDITGGMKQKVIEAARISAENDIEVYIFDGSTPDAIKRAYKFGEGTRVRVSKVPSL